MTPENVFNAVFAVLLFVIVRGLFFMFRAAENEKREHWRIIQLERELEMQSEFTHELQQRSLRRIAEQYGEERAMGVLGCGCRCDCGCDEQPQEKQPFRIHVSQPYSPPPRTRRQPEPTWHDHEHHEHEDDDWEMAHIAHQQVPLLGKNWVGQLPWFADDVIDVVVDGDPPLEPLEPYEPPRKRGRPGKYDSQAKKQKAWREKQSKKKRLGV